MEIVILGSGTATPSLERNSSGLIIKTQKLWMAVDMGPGVMRRICEAEMDYKRIDAILITHFHPDHVADLVHLLFASNYEYGPARREPFTLIGPRGLEQFYDNLVRAYGSWIVPQGGRLIKKEMNAEAADTMQLAGLTIRSVPAAHSFPSLSYRVDADGVSVTISGDTDVSDRLTELASGSDVFICECSLPDALKVSGHLIPAEAGRIAAGARVGKLVLTHFYPPCDEVDVVAQASAVFSGEIIKAQDLMVIQV